MTWFDFIIGDCPRTCGIQCCYIQRSFYSTGALSARLVLLFTANQPTFLVLVPYPPFGLVTVSFTGLASYLLYLGIYSASISVSEDSRLRQSIRKAAIKESTQFLDSIGTAEMGQELEKRVIAMTTATRQNMERETGISSSFDEDIRKYLQEALQEIRRGRNDGKYHKGKTWLLSCSYRLR